VSITYTRVAAATRSMLAWLVSILHSVAADAPEAQGFTAALAGDACEA